MENYNKVTHLSLIKVHEYELKLYRKVKANILKEKGEEAVEFAKMAEMP